MRQHLPVAALILTASLVSGAPARALSVNVPLPQTPVQVPQTEVTAPGAEVTLGPGGANVTLDPNKAVGGVTGALPGGSPPPGSSAPGSSDPGSPGPGSSAPGAPTGTAGSFPEGGSGGGSGGGENGASGPGGTTGTPRSGPARGEKGSQARTPGDAKSGSGASAPGRADAPDPAQGRRSAAQESARAAAESGAGTPTSLVRQLFEKVRTELLVALVVLALFGSAMSLVWLRERIRVRKALRRAEVDPLTGIGNRLAFDHRLADEWKRARRYGRRLGLLLIDLDGLKRVNDTDGHEAGDRMIKAAAERIAADTRQSDFAARLAGDEFVVLCPETSAQGLAQLGAKLTDGLAEGGIAASVGSAELAEGEGPADLLARADAAMYEQKSRRRRTRSAATARAAWAIAG